MLRRAVRRSSVCRRALAACAIATIAVLASPGYVPANNGFSINDQDIELEFLPLTMRGIEGGSSFSIECNVTLAGSFEARTFSIRSGPVEVGVIDRAAISGCSAENVRVSFLQETLPWDVVWAGYTGVLPDIESIEYEIRGLRILIGAEPFLACLFRSTQATPATLRWNINTWRAVGDQVIDETSPLARLSSLSEEDFFTCPGALELSGVKYDPPPPPLEFMLV